MAPAVNLTAVAVVFNIECKRDFKPRVELLLVGLPLVLMLVLLVLLVLVVLVLVLVNMRPSPTGTSS